MKRSLASRSDRALAVGAAETAGVALWRRVADQIERAIADGSYPADTRLPGEIEIALRLGVNRHTVRRALAALAERGLVRPERGSGTYVEAKRLLYPIHARTRFCAASTARPSPPERPGCRPIAHPMPAASTGKPAR